MIKDLRMHSNHFSNSFWIWTNARFEASEFFSILIENELRNEIDLFVCGYIIQLIDVNLKYEYVRQDTASNPLLTLRNNTFSNSFDIFSSMGPTSLHGLHQVAQKFAQTKISWICFIKSIEILFAGQSGPNLYSDQATTNTKALLHGLD